MAFLETLIERVLIWLLELWGAGLTPSELQELQLEGGLLSNIPVLFQILRRRRAAARFDAVLSGFPRDRESTLDLLQLYQMVGPPSLSWFVEQLNTSHKGSALVSTSFRVSSPKHSDMYRDYSSFDEIPPEVHDERSGTSFKPNLNFVKVVARVRAAGIAYASARY